MINRLDWLSDNNPKRYQERTFVYVNRAENSQKYYIIRLYKSGRVESAYGRMVDGDNPSVLSDNQKSTTWHNEDTASPSARSFSIRR